MKDIVVFTAISADYDELRPVPELWREEAECIAFIEGATAVPGWHGRPLHREFEDPCRNAKIHKILPHRYFPDARYTVWIDGAIEIKATEKLTVFLQRSLAQRDLAVFPHRTRNCIYEEARACIKAEKDAEDVIAAQIERYRNDGYPPGRSLAECTVIVRRNTPSTREFSEAWYREICAHSRRDQLSFDYTTWKLGFEHAWLPGRINNNAHFRRHRHIAQRIRDQLSKAL